MTRRHRRRLGRGLFAAYLLICVATIVWFGRAYWPTPQPLQLSGPLQAATYYRNCARAHAAGVYSIPRGAPGYRAPLDADADGLACEPYP